MGRKMTTIIQHRKSVGHSEGHAKREVHYTNKMEKPTNAGKFSNVLLNNQWIDDQIKTDQAIYGDK